MSQLKNMSILLVIAFATTILQNTEAVDHLVGGSPGWFSTPPGGAKFYSDWASNATFKVNDVLVFHFATGAHTVAEISKADFDNCNVNQNTQAITTSPARVTLNKTGDFYFTCTIQDHCNNGQKLSVKVVSASSSPAPAQGPSPPSSTTPSPTPPSSGTTPTPPSPTPPVSGDTPSPSSPAQPGATPPSPGSATSLVATFSIFFAVVINLLF
ncbi:umecyanin-like [Trifolium pratense]|uniref:umecyanin-like n=1 Tax=Trifolium pratense TaxID=57577 RepID=UPI001E69295B|nr:umecyanin-like [Trifolium pratense]